MIDVDKAFDGFCGQRQAKKTIGFYLGKYCENQGYFPPTLLTGARGDGKSTLCRKIGTSLLKMGSDGKPELNPDGKTFKRKKFIEINCASLTLNSFVNDVFIPHIEKQDVTIFLEEFSEVPRQLEIALLSIFETDKKETEYTYNGYKCRFDFRRNSFVMATSEPDKVYKPLLSRLEEVPLLPYEQSEVCEIIQNGCQGIVFEDGVLEEMAKCSRGSGRDSSKLNAAIKLYLTGKKTFTMDDWDVIRDKLGIFPLGLNLMEVTILKHLAKASGPTSLTTLSAKTNLSPEALRSSVELFLLRNNFMCIQAKGRVITPHGTKYLQELGL